MKSQNEKLRQIRKSRKLTLRELAAVAGVDASTISKFERGKVDIRIGQLRALVEALGISVEEFYNET